VDHPNIVKFLGQYTLHSTQYLVSLFRADMKLIFFQVFEYMEKGNVLHYLNKTEVSFEEMLHIMIDTCKAMVYLSGLGILHRDLALRNMLVT